jgi:hypothetical protein
MRPAQWPPKSDDRRVGRMRDDVAKQLKVSSTICSAKTQLDQNVPAARHRFPCTLQHPPLKSFYVDLQKIWSIIGVQNSI